MLRALSRGSGVETDPCDSPPLGLVRIVEERIWVAKHLGRELGGKLVVHREPMVFAKDLGRLVHERRRLAHGRVESPHVVVHGCA